MPAVGDAIDIVFINLDRARDRRAFMERQGERHGLPLRRARACEAADVSEELYATLSSSWERPLTRIEVAVFLSHKALWTQAAASRRGLVVLEDDAVISPRLGAFAKDPPGGFDLVNLECFERRKFMGRTGVEHGANVALVPVARDKAGAAAYFLSPAGAGKLLALAERHAAPADAFMFAQSRLAMAQAEPAMAMQVHLLAARGLDVGIETSTSIHRPRQRLTPSLANWPFHRRRLATQLRLAGFQARRLADLDFRKPAFDEAEFRAFLPIRLDAGAGAGDQDAQSRS